MHMLDVCSLIMMSTPVMDRFALVEPCPWDRTAILSELLGELGSLAHCCQHWDGFKRGQPSREKMADECSDVLFILLRLARQDCLELPDSLEYSPIDPSRATALILELGQAFSRLSTPTQASQETLIAMLKRLAQLAVCLDFDLVSAHRHEMEIAMQFFVVCGDRWPKPQWHRHPLAAWRLRNMLREKKQWLDR